MSCEADRISVPLSRNQESIYECFRPFALAIRQNLRPRVPTVGQNLRPRVLSNRPRVLSN